jgi:hypothetical protein
MPAAAQIGRKMTPLTEWQNFYVIVGSSAGALIGLQFVVMALIANMPRLPGLSQAGGTFMTPTVVHFGAALLLAGAMAAPWRAMAPVAALWAIVGLLGALYGVIVTLRLRRPTTYKPEFEDWLFHSILPLVAYGGLIASACFEFSFQRAALFDVAAATLLLLFIGIHNAWDLVTYHVFVKGPEQM